MNLPALARRPDPARDAWVPVAACTLPTADQPLRVAEFDDLFATALRATERGNDPARARLLLAGGDDLADRVQQLADAETACCSFFTFTLTELTGESLGAAEGAVLALDIEVPVTRVDVLAALVRRAEQAGRAGA
jgi:hypothetical protein